ncbi:MAG: GTP 3',8-cyclase MoaA [Hyphomonadaceae bacterium]|nr:GTP 3',8-cyclase MoaA [Hyphomonadaceae bacterium]
MQRLEDGFGRRFPYLRLSVTEACNFRCTYCLPNGYRKSAPNDFLSVDEVSRLVRAFHALGVQKVRLTGGEPSVRGDLVALIAAVTEAGVEKVALTTNGWRLARGLKDWVRAGLTHLNVSADSLDPSVFARVTGHDRLSEVLAGVDAALTHPRLTVKLNAVLLRDTLSEGFSAYASYLKKRKVSVRFIELMRTGDNAAFFAGQHVPGSELRNWLRDQGWSPVERGYDDGPATEFSHPEYEGRFGLIAPYAPSFCDSCNRLRVTGRGKLRLCLFGDGGVDLRDVLQTDEDRDALMARITDALFFKPRRHALLTGNPGDTKHLAELGG